jgi:hypothetical protein
MITMYNNLVVLIPLKITNTSLDEYNAILITLMQIGQIKRDTTKHIVPKLFVHAKSSYPSLFFNLVPPRVQN